MYRSVRQVVFSTRQNIRWETWKHITEIKKKYSSAFHLMIFTFIFLSLPLCVYMYTYEESEKMPTLQVYFMKITKSLYISCKQTARFLSELKITDNYHCNRFQTDWSFKCLSPYQRHQSFNDRQEHQNWTIF